MTFSIALLVFVACLAGGIALAVFRAISLWRQVKRTGRAVGAELDRISRAVGEIEGQLSRAGDAGGRLRAVQERLAVSRARLELQRAALREARAQVGRLLWFVPGR